MAAEGIAKRATIGVGFHTNQDAINAFEHSLRTIGEDTSKLRDTFNRTNHVMDRFNEHMSSFTGHYRNSMNGIREANRQAVESTHHVSNALRNSTDTYNHNSDKFSAADRRIIESERQKFENVAENEHKINERLSQTATDARHSEHALEQQNKRLQSKLSSVGNASTHTSHRIASANGRVAHSFHFANSGIGRHIQSVRDAQSRDYRWLRTAQDMSGATLGLGAAFYKGAKDAGVLQQSYIHAGNMAHYGGEKIKRVQHDINEQWRVGSNLSVKYGISQDQIAQGYQALVARGYTTNESLHTQKSLLQAAIASGDNYNDVVKDSTNVLDAYNMRSQNAATMTNNTRKVVNEMAYAADQTATNFQGLGIGMSYVAATAHTTHQSISETSSALGILSNKGMQASQAGVGLRKVLNSFLSVNKKGQQAQVMKQLGLSEQDFKTSSGHLKSLGALMTLLNDKTKNMDSQERGAVFHRFFGATGQEAALNLASDTKGLASLNKQVEKSQNMGHGKGYVALLSAHNMKSAQNQFNKFKQAWQAFTITSAREILPAFTGVLKHLDVVIAKLNNLSPQAKKWTIFGALAVAAISPISYAIFGIQSAFHGVEITLLHVRKLFSKPLPKGMTDSANEQAGQQEKDALEDRLSQDEKTGRSSYMDRLEQREFDHPEMTKLRHGRQRLGGRIWATNRGALSHITNFGGDYRFKPGVTDYEKMVAKPSMIARLNPFNKSARLFTHRFTSFLPGIHRLPAVTGRSASYLLRGSGLGTATRLGGTILGKANIITGIATSLPLVEKGLKWIDKTRIGGKLFAPLNKSLIKGMNGPVKFINRSWKFIKRGALDAIKPIEHEWHKMFSGESKASRSNLRGLKAFVHISTGLIGGLWRTLSKVIGNILKYAGHAIAGIIKTFRGLATILGGVADIFTGHWERAFHLLTHGANITFSGIWNTVSAVAKGIGTSIGDVANGVWTTMKHVGSTIGNGLKRAGHSIESYFAHPIHVVEEMFEGFGERVGELLDGIKHKYEEVKNTVSHPIKSGEHFLHHFATGGAIDHTQNALVNEKGQESAYNPTTNQFRMLGNNGPQVVKLYQGEHVLNAQDTRELLTTGMGRGVTLPGYANGTDRLNNLHGVIPGYVYGTERGGAIERTVAHQSSATQGIEGTAAKDSIDTAASWLNIPHDLTSGGNVLQRLTKAAVDTPVGALGHVAEGPLSSLRDLHSVMHPFSHMVDLAKDPLRGAVKKLGHFLDPDDLNRNFKKIAPALSEGLDYGLSKAKNVVHKFASGFSGNVHRAWNRAKQAGHTAMSKLRHFGHTFGNVAGKAWNGIKNKAGHAWRGLKHGASHMWHSARHLGHVALSGLRHFGRNIGHGIRHFGHSALHVGSQLSHKVGRGVRHFSRWLARTGRKMFRKAGRDIRRFGRGAMRQGRRIVRGGRRLLRRAGRGIHRFGRRAIRGTKRVARSMWRSMKRAGRNIWRNAKRVGRNVWNNSKRVARDVGRGAHSLWNRTKRGASNTWSRVVSGARRMASRAKSIGSRAWSAIKSGAEDAKSVADRMLSGIISFAHKAAHAIRKVVTLGGLIGHHANGGAITHNELSLVGEHGPETAYNTRTGAVRMLGMNGPQITTLLAGEEVLTNTQTNRLLHGGLGAGTRLPSFAKGTGKELDNSNSHIAPKSSIMSITGMFSGKTALNNMKNFSKKSKSIWDELTSYITKSTKDTHSNNNDEWEDMAKDLGKINDDLSKNTRSSFSDMSQKVTKLASDLHDGLVDAASDMASGFGDKFKKLITYAKDDMEDVIDKLNKGVSGIDVALKAFGGNSHVIHKIHYATGTMNGHLTHNQLGILNDATTGPRQEAILRGNSVLFPQGNDVTVPLRKGDAVLNGDQTKQLINNTTNINHYAKGSGLHLNFKHIGELIKTIGLALKGPAAFFKKTFSHLVGNPVGHQLTKGMEESGMKAAKPLGIKWTRAMFNFIHSLLNPDGVSASASAFLNYAEKHRPHNYVYGGAPGFNDTDCSGFVEACLNHFGISAPRTSGAQIAHFEHITRSEARPGDLLGTGAHVGIVADNGAHHYFSNHGPNGAHPAASMTPYVPSEFPGGAASFARVPQLAKYNKPKHKKATPFLQRLVAEELGSPAIHWLKALAPMIGSGGSAGLASGSGAISAAWNEFAKLGMSPTQIEGALGGAQQESNFNPDVVSGDGGYGLFQITPRASGVDLKGFANSHHTSWTNPALQALCYYEKFLKPSGYLSTHGSVRHEAEEAASVEAHSKIDAGFASDTDFSNRLDGAYRIQKWYNDHKHANGGWANSPAIFGEAGPEVAINPNRDTADHLIIQAIAARMHHSPNSPIAGLVKSLGIRRRAHSLVSDIKDLVTGNKPEPKHDNTPIKINVTNNITINGNPGTNQAHQITHNVEKAIQRGIQRAALRTRNRLDW